MHKISQECSDQAKIGGMCKVTVEICNRTVCPSEVFPHRYKPEALVKCTLNLCGYSIFTKFQCSNYTKPQDGSNITVGIATVVLFTDQNFNDTFYQEKN